MSYDVYLFPQGTDAHAAYLALEDDEDEADEGPADALLDALEPSNPAWYRSARTQLWDDRPSSVIAESYGSYGVLQISYGADDPPLATSRLVEAIRLATAEGWTAYDPQLERVVTGGQEDAAAILAVVARIHDDLISRHGAPAKPRGLLGRLFKR